MQTGNKKYKLVHRVKDTRFFNIDHLHHYSLALQLGKNDFQICVNDVRNDTCLLVEDYIFPQAATTEDRVEILKNLFDEHHFLMANFWQSVKLSFKTSKFSMVPADAFDSSATFDYLKFNAPLNPDQQSYYHARLPYNDIICVFAVDTQLLDFYNSIYQNIEAQLYHQSCGLISGIFSGSDRVDQKYLYIYLDRLYLHILVTEDQRLFYYNQFVIKRFPDYIKYIKSVANELDYDLQQQPLTCWGYIKKNSNHLKELHKYFPKIKLGGPPSFLKQGFMFDELPEHHYLDVYGIYLLNQ